VRVVQVMTPFVAWSLRSDWPRRPVAPRTPSCRHLPRRRDDRQPTRACPPSRTPGPDERTTNPRTHPWGTAHRAISAAHIVIDHGASLKALRPLRGRAPPEPWPRRPCRRVRR